MKSIGYSISYVLNPIFTLFSKFQPSGHFLIPSFMFNIFKSASKQDILASAKQKLRALVTTHLKTLAIKRVAGITIDAYNNVDGSKWIAESQYFMDKVLLPLLSIEETKEILNAGMSAIAQELIEGPVRAECQRMHDTGEHDMTVRTLHPPESKATATLRSTMLPTGKSPDGVISRGLIIREEPLDRILNGAKTWEMRSAHTKIRGPVALIRKGSKAIFGIANIVDSRGPFSRAEMLESVRFHAITPSRLDSPEVSNYHFAWVLQNVHRLPRAINYQHKGGVIFVTLDELAIAELETYRRGSK